MARQIKGLLYFFVTNIRYNMIVFWSILVGTLVVGVAFAYFLLNVEEGFMGFSISFATYFYCIFTGFFTVRENVPFAIKMGATRKNIYVAIAIYFLGIALFFAIVGNLLQSIVILFTDMTGIDTLQFYHLSLALEDNWLTRVMIDVLVLFFLLTFMFLLGLIFRRFGMIGGGSIVAILAVTLLLSIAKGWVFEFISNLVTDLDMMFFVQVFGIGVIWYGLSYFIVNRITIR